MKLSKLPVAGLYLWMCLCALMISQISCTHDDQVLDEYIPEPTGEVFSKTELIAKNVSTAPTIDASIDLIWDDAQKLINEATVPDPGDDLFAGYVGDSYNFTMRALYDATDIYFLLEWMDNSMDLNRQTWYFESDSKLWKQESRYPTFNGQGVQTREAFYEDKFAILWNVDNSVSGWNNSTCFASCHTNLGAANGFARHYTNGPGERVDMWHWKSVRNGIAYGLADDQYQDEVQPNGRHSDAKVSGGYTNNVQSFDVNGSSVSVPKYVIPGAQYYFWITKDEIDAGTAKLITGVDEDGVLSYDGGTIDPNTETEFQRDGSTAGPKGIPSVYIEPWVGSRGDLQVAANYTGSGWVMELQRKLKTGDVDGQDVDFSSLEDQPFGIGIFDNAALAHAITANLILKFD